MKSSEQKGNSKYPWFVSGELLLLLLELSFSFFLIAQTVSMRQF